MKLYHGTTKTAMVHIIDEGIKPRGENRGNWDMEVDSHPEAVYFTDAYPLHFARCAQDKYDDEIVAIVEIDTDSMSLDPDLFAPDEDFMEQASRKNPEFEFLQGKDMVERTAWFRDRCLIEFSHYWDLSLQHLGTCAYYGHIPVDAITRYALLPYNHRFCLMSDPTITLANYKLMGHYYRGLTRMVFGDDPATVPEEGLLAAHINSQLAPAITATRTGVRVFSRDPSNRLKFTAVEAV